MGEAGVFPPEKLIMPVLFSRREAYLEARNRLIRRFGPLDYDGAEFPFEFSHYYDKEMDGPISRVFLAFSHLVDPSTLWKIKRVCNRIEQEHAVNGGQRRVNLDPGLLDLNRLVLATTKHAGHRIALKRGIYAEITLHYRRGAYQPFDWTYPDYRTDEYQKILMEIRRIYHRQLKQI